MKTMTCNQLGGACDLEFHADSFEEVAEQSKKHGMEMAEQQEAAHLAAMEAMKEKMQNPEAMREWMDEKRREFEATADD